jgi:SAM-dependent methyltransferase
MGATSKVTLMADKLFRNLLLRIWHRILEIPTRGLPRGTRKDSFDAEHGTNTSGVQWWTNPRSENFVRGVRYEPCSPELCRMAIERSGVVPKQFCFLDIGCGKGRPLIIASEYGFKELIGVDYSAKLCRVAEQNLKACGVERFRIINSDATRFHYRTMNTMAFLYHPFKDDVLGTVLEKLRTATSGHELVIAYVGSGGDLMLGQEWLEQIHGIPSLRIFRKHQAPGPRPVALYPSPQ